MRSFQKMKQEKVELLLNATGLECPEDPKLNLTRLKSRAVQNSNLNLNQTNSGAQTPMENLLHGNNLAQPESPTTQSYKLNIIPRSSIKTIGPFSAFNPNQTDAQSNPGTVTDMQDFFEECQPLKYNENQLASGAGSIPNSIPDLQLIKNERSQSFDEETNMIRLFGDKLLRSSAQGYLLLRAKRQ